LGLADYVQAAAAMQEQIAVRKYLHVPRQAALRPPYAFRHGLDPSEVRSEQSDDLVGVSETPLAQDDSFRRVGSASGHRVV
jgi:hypothetical protein